MEDTRDKRPVYMSTFQKRTDKMKSELKLELDELDERMNSINRRTYWFFAILLLALAIALVYRFMF
jgi:hypothetical protein